MPYSLSYEIPIGSLSPGPTPSSLTSLEPSNYPPDKTCPAFLSPPSLLLTEVPSVVPLTSPSVPCTIPSSVTTNIPSKSPSSVISTIPTDTRYKIPKAYT